MKTIEMNIAIIPNKAHKAIDESCHTKKFEIFIRKHIDGYNRRFGLDIKDDDLMVELWYGSEKESYQNGGLPEEFNRLFPAEDWYEDSEYMWDKYDNRLDILPSHLPARMFEGLKEGDKVLLFKSENCEVYGVLAQYKNRYRGFGSFESVFENVTRWCK